MSQWTKILRLREPDKLEIFRLYKKFEIPIDIRIFLAHWIETEFIHGENENDQNEATLMWDVIYRFLQEINRLALLSSHSCDISSIKLRDAFDHFRDQEKYPFAQLYKNIKYCLEWEKRLLDLREKNEPDNSRRSTQASSGSGSPQASPGEMVMQLNVDFETLSQRIYQVSAKGKVLDQIVHTIQQHQREHQARMRQKKNYESKLAPTNGYQPINNDTMSIVNKINDLEADIQKLESKVRVERKKFDESVDCIVHHLWMHQVDPIFPKFVHNYLAKLKWSEATPDEDLGCTTAQIRQCYQELVNCLWSLRSHFLGQASFQSKLEQVDELLRLLLDHMIIVVQQPLRVSVDTNKMDTRVLFLGDKQWIVGGHAGHSSSSNRNEPTVNVSLFSESEVQELFRGNNVEVLLKSRQNPIDIEYEAPAPKQQESFEPGSNILVKDFKRMNFSKKIKARKPNEMPKKYCLIYWAQVSFKGCSKFPIWCCSVPFVLLTNACQKSDGWAPMFWEKYVRFWHQRTQSSGAQAQRQPFEVPASVSLSVLSKAMNHFFDDMALTGEPTKNPKRGDPRTVGRATKRPGRRQLFAGYSLTCLSFKIFKSMQFNEDSQVTIEQLVAKDSENKSVWNWYYAIIELVRKHLQPYWDNGVIMGIIRRAIAERTMAKSNPGSFMLRFSDNDLGALSICCRGHKGPQDLGSWGPLRASDFESRSLRDRIFDMMELQYVVTFDENKQGVMRPKDVAFDLSHTSNSDDLTQVTSKLSIDDNNCGNVGSNLDPAPSGPYKKFALLMVINTSSAFEQPWHYQAFDLPADDETESPEIGSSDDSESFDDPYGINNINPTIQLEDAPLLSNTRYDMNLDPATSFVPFGRNQQENSAFSWLREEVDSSLSFEAR